MNAAALSFASDTHEYRHPDGRLVPSVTQILSAVGVSVDFDELGQSSTRLRDAIALRRDLGTAVHADAHAYDDDDLDWSSMDPRVAPYIESWAAFRDNLRAQPLARERRVFHPALFYCGTLDGIFDVDGKRVLIDTKIGDPDDAGAEFQTAGYEMAYLVEHANERIDERWAVQLIPGRRVPYTITNYSARQDARLHGPKFRAFITTYWEQAARRRSRGR